MEGKDENKTLVDPALLNKVSAAIAACEQDLLQIYYVQLDQDIALAESAL